MTIPTGAFALQNTAAGAASTASKSVRIFRPTEAVVDLLADCQEFEVDFDQERIYFGTTWFSFKQAQETLPHELLLMTTAPGRAVPSVRAHGAIVGRLTVEPKIEGGLPDRAHKQNQAAETAKQAKRTKMLTAPPPPLPSTDPLPKPKPKAKIKKLGATSTTSTAPKRASASAPIQVKDESARPSAPSITVRQITTKAVSTTATRRVSPLPPPPTPSSSTSILASAAPIPGTTKLLRLLALSEPMTRDDIYAKMDKDEATVNEILSRIAEPAPALKKGAVATGSTQYRLKARSWRDVKPYKWMNLSQTQRNMIAEKACTVLETLGVPENDPIWENVRPRVQPQNTAAKPLPPKHTSAVPSKPTAASTSSSTRAAAAGHTDALPAKQAAPRRSEPVSSASAAPRPAKSVVKRERELGEIEDDLETPPPVHRRVPSTASQSVARESSGDSSVQVHRVRQAAVGAATSKDLPPIKKKVKQESVDGDREPRRAREDESDRERLRRKEEKRRRLDEDGSYKPQARERARETPAVRERDTSIARESDSRRVRRERSPSPVPRKKRERSASPPPRYERSVSPAPVKRKPKREPSPPVKTKRDVSPKPKLKREMSPVPVKSSRHARESSSASSRSKKPLPNYTSSEDEAESTSSRERRRPEPPVSRPPQEPIPTDRRGIEQRYKRGYSTYNILSAQLHSQRMWNELALNGDEAAEAEILSESELTERVTAFKEWHDELSNLRKAFEKLDGHA